jgi:hypothetical protein
MPSPVLHALLYFAGSVLCQVQKFYSFHIFYDVVSAIESMWLIIRWSRIPNHCLDPYGILWRCYNVSGWRTSVNVKRWRTWWWWWWMLRIKAVTRRQLRPTSTHGPCAGLDTLRRTTKDLNYYCWNLWASRLLLYLIALQYSKEAQRQTERERETELFYLNSLSIAKIKLHVFGGR